MLRLHALFVLCLLAANNTQAQSSLGRTLDSLINTRLPGVAPGCAILVVQKGRVLYRKAFGSANLELHVPMRPEMVFRIGSITKQYTAIAILQLVQQGRLSLSDSLQTYIPDYPHKPQSITLENLLTHTSGIPDYEALDFPIPTAIRVDFPAKQIIDSLSPLPLEFRPGTKFHYSNSNYFLLAYILEKVSKQPYADYLQEHLFRPAGLTHTCYDSPEKLISDRVSGYSGHDHHFTNAGYISMTQVFGAGALLSTVDDLYKWHQALNTGQLVDPALLKKAFTPYRLTTGDSTHYGYGWIIQTRNGLPTIEHAGGIDGFQSDEIWFPGRDIFIATLYNALNEGGDDPAFMALDRDIATLALGQQPPKEITLDSAALQPFVGEYESDPGHHALITLQRGQLYMEAKAGGLPKSLLTPISGHVFLLKTLGAQIEFTSAGNTVTQLIVHFNGQEQTAKKIR